MSYSEYLRRKAAAAPVIIDPTPKKVDASFYTSKVRMASTVDFGVDGSSYGTTVTFQDRSGNLHTATSYKKATGRPAAASDFTQYTGGQAIGKDIQSGMPAGKVLLNSNSAGSLSACRTVGEPAPFTGGAFAPNNVPMTGSGFLNNTKHCQDLGRVEPHTANELGKPLAVLNLRTYVPPPGTDNCQSGIPYPCQRANHTHPADNPHTQPTNRNPIKTGVQRFVSVASPDQARKVGNFNPRKPAYVEKHHGNDLSVNPRRVPTKFQIPAGTPAHLKINDPQVPKVPGN